MTRLIPHLTVMLVMMACSAAVDLRPTLPTECPEGTVRTALGECETPFRDGDGATTTTPADTDDTDAKGPALPTVEEWWADMAYLVCDLVNTCAKNDTSGELDCDAYYALGKQKLDCDYNAKAAVACLEDLVDADCAPGGTPNVPESCGPVCE